MNTKALLPTTFLLALTLTATAQTPTTRPTPPTRDPHTPGYVTATELPDGTVPSSTTDGNFILGPTHNPAPKTTPDKNTPRGTIFNFTPQLHSEPPGKIYPWHRPSDPKTFGIPDPNDPAKIIRPPPATPHPTPRKLAVYRSQTIWSTGTAAPTPSSAARRPRPHPLHRPPRLPLIAWEEHKSPRHDRHLHRQRQRRRPGNSQPRPRIHDTMSGLYAELVEKEILPFVQSHCNVQLSSDPDARATMGGSSWRLLPPHHGLGSTPNFTMQRSLPYSGTFVNQQWPQLPDYLPRRSGIPRTPHPQLPRQTDPYLDGSRRPRTPPQPQTPCPATICTTGSSPTKTMALPPSRNKNYHYQFIFRQKRRPHLIAK